MNKAIQALLFFTSLVVSVVSHAALDIQHWKTSEGTRVYFVENHDLPIIDLKVTFAAGGAYDTPETNGVAGLTAYLMKLGAAGMSDADIAKGFADVGAVMGAGAAKDSTSFSLRTLSSESEQHASLNLFKQVLHQPDFPEAVLAREKKRIVAGLKEAETQPDAIATKAYMQAIYGNHPYALGAKKSEATVNQIERKDLIDFYQQYYSADNAVIAMIGDLTKAQAEAVAEGIVNGLPKGGERKVVPAVVDLNEAVVERISHPATQAHVMIGAPAISRDNPDRIALLVGNYILGGGGFVSRFTEEVREKRGLVYSVYSYFSPMKQRGPFLINFQTKQDQADEALKVVNATLQKFMQEGVTEAELNAAKANIIGGFPMKIDSNKKILSYLSVIGFNELPLTYLEDYNEKVAAVTAAEIKAAFQKHVKPEQFVTVVVGAE